MRVKRMWQTIRLCLIPSSAARAAYAKKAKVFAGVGEHVAYTPRFVPLYSELIRFHSNIVVARGVDFVTHDTMHMMFNRMHAGRGEDFTRLRERIGCIEIMDNVFIGAHSLILYNTRIGPNVVIASGSVVTKDLEPGGVYAGVPARRIGDVDTLFAKRAQQETDGSLTTTRHNQALTEQEVNAAWAAFTSARPSRGKE